MIEPKKYEGDINLLKYIMYILSDSRTKKHAERRISGLLQTRLEKHGEVINDYRQEKKPKEQIPQTPLRRFTKSIGERTKKT